MRDMEKEVYFTPREAATHFNLSLSTVKNYIYAGKLKTLKTPGGHHRIRKSELLSTLGDRILANKARRSLSFEKSLCTAILAVFRMLGPAGEYLTMHARNVSGLSCDIARAMNMSESRINIIEIAGLVHDIGHIAIDKSVLLKQGLLSPEEYELLKQHPEAGEKILVSMNGLKDIADIVVQHHERIDGKGYPRGLKGSEILKESRIISVAESYDAMVSEHYYKMPISREAAISELERQKGRQFDGDVVEELIKHIEK